MSARTVALMAALLSGIAGCASVPARKVYVLDEAERFLPEHNDAPVEAAAGGSAPVLRLERVLVPDFLDTTDIVTRVGGHGLQSSPSGRWGERLSAGITRTLRSDLAVRLPGSIVAGAQSGDPYVRRILVVVDTFDVWTDGHCLLTANWTLFAKDPRDGALTGHGAFTTPAAGATAGDAVVIAAMANAVSQLADGIAATVKRL